MENTSPHVINLSPGLECHKNALEIAAGQSEVGREGGRNALNPAGESTAASVQGLGRRRAQGSLQPRPKYFAWLMQQKAADGRSFTGRLAAREAGSLLAATWSWQLGAWSRKKRRAGMPAPPTCVDGAEHRLEHASWLPAN